MAERTGDDRTLGDLKQEITNAPLLQMPRLDIPELVRLRNPGTVRIRINVEAQKQGFKPDVTLEWTGDADAMPTPQQIQDTYDRIAERAVLAGQKLEAKTKGTLPLEYDKETIEAWIPMTPPPTPASQA